MCGAGCGFCGRCTAAWEREDEPAEACAHCGGELPSAPVDAIVLTTGAFCSVQCVDECEANRSAGVPASLKGATE